MRKTKETLFNKLERMAIFKDRPPHIIAIMIILGALAVFLVLALIIKLFAPQPKSYDEYFENIDAVIQVERDAALASQVYQPLEMQLGDRFYENEVLGIDPMVAEVHESAVNVQREAIRNVEINNQQVRDMGGIATPAELEKYYSGNPKNAAAAAKVQEAINASQGKF